MRGLIKRDDPKLQASVASTHHQVLLVILAAWRRMPRELRCRWGSCRCACTCAQWACYTYTSTSTVLWSLIRRRGVHSLEACCTHPLICRSHAHPRPPLLASSSCFPRPQLGLLVRAWLALSIGV